MRYLASAFGSAGDFLPTLAAAEALARRGHEVTFITNAFHERTVRAAGLEYVGTGEHVDLYKLITDDPALLTSPRVLQVMAEDLARPHYTASFHTAQALLQATRPDAVIGSNLAFGLLWAAIDRGVPAVMVTATPLFWASGEAPVQFLDFEIPSSLLSLAVRAVRTVGVGMLDHMLRSIARTAGATRIDASYSAVEARVALHVGTWPELMRPRAQRDLANMRACGFVHGGHLGASSAALAPALESFLSEGEPPVVVALGSIFSLGADTLVADAAEACADLGRRCVIVGPPPRDRALPEGTLVVPYATYQRLFPRAAALVIHGGAGTTGEALESGRPSVVVPFAFDQFGLSWQVERLGAGVRVPKRGRGRESIAAALRRALDADTVARAAEIGAALRGAPDGAEVIADHVVALG